MPVWPVLFLALKPLWLLLPASWRDRLKGFWEQTLFPRIEPLLEKLPPAVRKFAFYGMPTGKVGREKGKKAKQEVFVV